MNKITKITAAIQDTKNRLGKTREDIMLLKRQEETLQEQLNLLESINNNKSYE